MGFATETPQGANPEGDRRQGRRRLPELAGLLTQDQMVGGLKEALGKGVRQAVASLRKSDGFLKDASVKIPMPENLQKVEK